MFHGTVPHSADIKNIVVSSSVSNDAKVCTFMSLYNRKNGGLNTRANDLGGMVTREKASDEDTKKKGAAAMFSATYVSRETICAYDGSNVKLDG